MHERDEESEVLLGDVKPIQSPKGLDLNPPPPATVRLSKRAVALGIGALVAILLVFAYGGYKRQNQIRTEAAQKDVRKNVAPASHAGQEFTKDIPAGNVPMTHRDAIGAALPPAIHDLRPPNELYASGSGPVPGMAPANERVLVRQSPPPQAVAAPAHTAPPPLTEAEKRLAAAYEREREAMLAPTGVRGGSVTPPRSSMPNQSDDISRIAALTQALTASPKQGVGLDALKGALTTRATEGVDDFDSQNGQSRKEAFLKAAQSKQGDEYLRSTRVAPISRYEIKAGWEIPAVLEQGLNSSLPGGLKALVSANVYDTATGLHLLIPQGSRLVGRYDSHVSYGQDGVQVVWDRLIFPDASSIDLNGMAGLDSHGNSGLRDKVDRHYRRLFGMATLSSLFAVSFELTQQRNRSVLAIPSPQETAGATVGREIGQVGAQITRRNLNVQPTIKVPAGYRFTVRVNRDIVFEAPYGSVPSEEVQRDMRLSRR